MPQNPLEVKPSETEIHPILRRIVMAEQLSWAAMSDILRDIAAELSHQDPEMANVVVWLQRACDAKGREDG